MKPLNPQIFFFSSKIYKQSSSTERHIAVLSSKRTSSSYSKLLAAIQFYMFHLREILNPFKGPVGTIMTTSSLSEGPRLSSWNQENVPQKRGGLSSGRLVWFTLLGDLIVLYPNSFSLRSKVRINMYCWESETLKQLVRNCRDIEVTFHCIKIRCNPWCQKCFASL